MSQSTTLILLPQTRYHNNGTSAPYDVTGEEVQAAGYYLGSQDLQTISFSFSEVTGTLEIEASLATTPASGDWFKIYEITANNVSNTNANLNSYTNLTGNFVYMRAKIKDFNNGVVEFVKVSY